LMMAARNSSPERGGSSEKTVEMLLKYKADPNKQERDGWTALMLAARYLCFGRGTSSERAIEILLGGGADPNKRNNSGRTALTFVNTQSVKRLIQKYLFL